MAVTFPANLDSLTNPASNSSIANPSHAQQHADANDAIEALEAKVGVDNSTVTTSLDYRVRALETQTVDPEDVQDIVGAMVSDNTETNLVVTYDAVNGKLNFNTGPDVVTSTILNNALALKAPLASPGLTGTPTAPTATSGTNTTQIATTEFVKTATDSAVTTANNYTDQAVTSLNNSISDPVTGYVPVGDVGSADGVASLGPDGKVPASELDIDGTIQSVASTMITGGTHTNLSVVYDNVNKVLNFTAQGGGGGASVSVSSNAPASPSLGDLWLDSDTAILYAYDGQFWVEISGAATGGGGGGGFTLSATAPTPATEGDAWFDTVNAKLYVYFDSYWVEAIATGATGPTGPMFLDYQGAWNSGVGYVNNEGVTYNGSLWRLNAANSPAGTIPSTPNWQLVVQKGDKGDTGEMSVGTVTTTSYGNPATVTNVGTTTDAVLNFVIPSGPRSTIAIGDVTDVDFGTPPTVTNVGTTSDAIFDFELTTGRASTLAVGTVTTAAYSAPATVTNVGTTSDAIFNFSIPQGVPGEFNVSATAPANPVQGNVWYNSNNGRAYIYYDGFWVEYAPGFVGPQGPAGSGLSPESISSNATMVSGKRYFVNTSSAITLTLPVDPSLNNEVQIFDASGLAATNNITVDRNTNKINGGTTNLTISTNGAAVTLIYTGSTYGWKAL